MSLSRQSHFYTVVNDITNDQIEEICHKKPGPTPIVSRELSRESTQEVLDSVHSGESLTKHFSFDTSKYNGNTLKCVAFWQALKKTGLQPVKCTLIEPDDIILKCTEKEEVLEGQHGESDSCMWYKALIELQKRKLDEVALAPITKQCRLCKREETYGEFKKRQSKLYSKLELDNEDDIICLNNWKSNIMKNKSITAQKTSAHTRKQSETKPTGGVDSRFLEQSRKPEDLTQCQCGWEECDCNKIRTKESDLQVTYDSRKDESNKRNDSEQCQCGWETCDCNKDFIKESVYQAADTSRRQEFNEQNNSSQCQCGWDMCDCNKVFTKASVSQVANNTSGRQEFNEQNDSSLCQCGWEMCDCNKGFIKESVSQAAETDRRQEFNKQNNSSQCQCGWEMCDCNKVFTKEFVSQVANNTSGRQEFNEQNGSSQCQCGWEMCDCNNGFIIESVPQAADTGRRQEFKEQNDSSQCQCGWEMCDCNNVCTKGSGPQVVNAIVKNESNKQKDSIQCQCGWEMCDCTNIMTNESNSQVVDTSGKKQNDQCGWEVCDCNEVQTKEPQFQVLVVADTINKKESILQKNSATCKYGWEICDCKKTLSANSCIVAADSKQTTAANADLVLLSSKRLIYNDIAEKVVSKKCTCDESDCACDKSRKGQETAQQLILPQCNICKRKCICWENKIALSKKLLDDLRYEMYYKQIKQDKPCQTSYEEEERKEDAKWLNCATCGHITCRCNNTKSQIRRKYLESVEFDENVLRLLQEQKEMRAKQNKPDRLLLGKYFKDLNQEIRAKGSFLENTESANGKAPRSREIMISKKLIIKPGQRKNLSEKSHVLESDKYGIPQVVRYADGRLGPKKDSSKNVVLGNRKFIPASKT